MFERILHELFRVYNVLRNARSKLTSMNQRITCAGHAFKAPHSSTQAHARDFSHRTHARFPAPATQNDARPRSRSHHLPHRPPERSAASQCTIHHTCHANPLPSALPRAHVHPEPHVHHATRMFIFLCTHASSTIPSKRHAIPRSSAIHTQNVHGQTNTPVEPRGRTSFAVSSDSYCQRPGGSSCFETSQARETSESRFKVTTAWCAHVEISKASTQPCAAASFLTQTGGPERRPELVPTPLAEAVSVQCFRPLSTLFAQCCQVSKTPRKCFPPWFHVGLSRHVLCTVKKNPGGPSRPSCSSQKNLEQLRSS